MRTNSEVVAINREAHTVTVHDLVADKTYEEAYDKLVLAPGAAPILPRSIEGIDRDNVFVVRNVTDIRALKAYCDKPETERVAVVGGGFIGIEVAENLVRAGKTVSLIEGSIRFLHRMIMIWCRPCIKSLMTMALTCIFRPLLPQLRMAA